MITFVMMAHVKYSVIIPVYNRPEEVKELLQSLVDQDYENFEIILVEDGSTITCKHIYELFTTHLTISYLFKQNSGPGPSKNFGYRHAKGEYFVVFDSDCILPKSYFSEVEAYMMHSKVDAWGGSDRGHPDFSLKQRSMAYTMSSVITTGGIRGGKKKIGRFQPRSFNMGISRLVYEKTGGFKFDRYAEDIELSIRIKEMGFNVAYIEKAFVFHKRRTNFQQFYKQVQNFGKGRVLVGRSHQSAIKLVHWFPAFFAVGLFSIPIFFLWSTYAGSVVVFSYLFYLILIFLDAFKTTSSIGVSLLAVPAAVSQLVGYGFGFLKEKLKIA